MADSNSDSDALPNKRQKIAHDDDKPIYDLERVVLMHAGSPVVQVPLLNFQTYAPMRKPDLRIEITEGETHRWKFYIDDVPGSTPEDAVKRWASWLIHFDLRAVMDGGPMDSDKLASALFQASYVLGESDYRDALIDAWMSWVQNGGPAGSLSTERLRRSGFVTYGLMGALILYHDAGAIAMEDNEDAHKSPYNDAICRKVRDLALISFAQPDRKPKDPLQMSDKEFCQKYHSHSPGNQPCYKTKSLPEQL
ncbi:hypothetical protein M436DRAFT_81486 [Aureobasidium namibiae CBS 147.97]|uniref:Uncharacterized protein n=1 Tax=Aureobasidium namibiae CBS 147.97 TaxID=1043004 RepID=A0A074WLT6_9PEZI